MGVIVRILYKHNCRRQGLEDSQRVLFQENTNESMAHGKQKMSFQKITQNAVFRQQTQKVHKVSKITETI